MSRRFRTGLVVGKFSPLHRGHELLLERARAQAEHVFCLSYSSPELGGCTALARRGWLAELEPNLTHLVLDSAELARLRALHPTLPELPHNDAPELEHRTFVAQICLDVWGIAVDAVFTSELYGDGFADELGRQFRARGYPNARVEHVLVDLARQQVPISASAIRADRELARSYLSPVVRASFVWRVALLGGESSGKTTLTQKLAAHFAAAHVEEYGRTRWIERGGQLDYDDYLLIARAQAALEETAARSAERLLFCDTTPLTTLGYCLDAFGRAEPELLAHAERRYDLALLCSPDIPFVQDGTRRDEAFRAKQQAFYLAELERRKQAFVLLAGSYEARFEQAVSAVCAIVQASDMRQI